MGALAIFSKLGGDYLADEHALYCLYFGAFINMPGKDAFVA